MKLEDHPIVKKYRLSEKRSTPKSIDYNWLRNMVLDAGADDAGFIEIDREEINDQKEDILCAFPETKTLISYACRVNEPHFKSIDRSLADVEFIAVETEMEQISRRVVKALRKNGIRAVVPTENFPMDMNKWPGKMWTVSHKPVAVAAGLGQLGHHRLLIHPVFGNYLCLGTMLIDVTLNAYDTPIDFNPCIECKLCVSVCPTGAIGKDGNFEFFSCFVHAYRDLDWADLLTGRKTLLRARTWKRTARNGMTRRRWLSGRASPMSADSVAAIV